MINSDNYNFIMINSHSCYYALHAICFNGMSILISVKVQKKLYLILSIYLFLSIAITFSYWILTINVIHYYNLIINSISFVF